MFLVVFLVLWETDVFVTNSSVRPYTIIDWNSPGAGDIRNQHVYSRVTDNNSPEQLNIS